MMFAEFHPMKPKLVSTGTSMILLQETHTLGAFYLEIPCSVAQASLSLILNVCLSPLPECCDYRCVSAYGVCVVLGIKSMVTWMLSYT